MRFRDDDHRSGVWSGLMSAARTVGGDRAMRMRSAADLLWEALSPVGVSWIGFYEIAGGGNGQGAEPGEGMLLGPHRDRPACNPIGLHGACGRAWRGGRALVIRRVASLGAGYVACDPRDVAEAVVPCFEASGRCWGVLDADSFEAGCFDTGDARELIAFVRACGLSASGAEIELI